MTLPAHSQYSECGLAWLDRFPAHWSLTKTKHVCDFFTGWTPPTGNAAAYDGDCLWANISDLGPRVIYETSKTISPNAAREHGIEQSPVGSLMFSFKLSIGQVSFVGRPMFTNEAIATFRESPRLSLAFAYYAFPLFLVQNAADNIYGAKLLNQSLIRAATFPLPPVEEQQAIAAFLDRETAKIDALIAEQEKLIALLAEKRWATISHAVTKGLNPDAPLKDSGILWLGEVPAHWEVRTISSACTKITNGYVGPTRDVLVDSGVRYLQSLHIKSNRIQFDTPYFVSEDWSNSHAKSILESGDVLIVQTGDIGQSAVVTDEFAGCNCHALIIVSPLNALLEGEWLSWVLNSSFGYHSLLSIQTGALHPHLNCGKVKQLYVPLPPKAEQQQISEWIRQTLGKLEQLSGSAVQAAHLLRERRSALIAAAVTGQIDVRGVAA